MKPRKKLNSKPESAVVPRQQSSKSKPVNKPQTQDSDNPIFGPVPPLFPEQVSNFYHLRYCDLTNEEVEADPVWAMINSLAQNVANRVGRPESSSELARECFCACKQHGKYSGMVPLEAYIYRILFHEALKDGPLVSGKFEFVRDDNETPGKVAYSSWKYYDLDDASINPRFRLDSRSLNLEEEIVKRLDREFRLDKFAERSPLHEVFVELVRAFITGSENYEDDDEPQISSAATARSKGRNRNRLSERFVASMATKKLGKEVKRNQAKKVLDEFRLMFRDLLPPKAQKSRSAFSVSRVPREAI